jgi:hypothetical protein
MSQMCVWGVDVNLFHDVYHSISVFQLVEEMGYCVIVVGRVWPSSCVVPIKKPL